jgi:hypothetical protein
MAIDKYPPTSRTLTELNWSYVAAGGELILSGYDSSNNVLQYFLGREKFFLNGVLLQRGVDYTAADGSTIVLVNGLIAGDVVTIQANNNYASTYIAASSINGLITSTQVDSTIATTASSQSLINKTISGALNTLSNIPNASLTNYSITLGSTNIALGQTASAITGLTLNGALNTLTNIPNSALANSTITLNGTVIPLGGTATFTGGSGSGLIGLTTTANTALGSTALQQLTTGTKNTAVGVGAQLYITNGSNNTAVGDTSLYANASGTENVAVGQNALASGVSASGNVAIGSQSFKNNISGGNNTVVGYNAALTLNSGSNNIILGNSANSSSASASNEVTLGNASITRLRIPGLGFDTSGVTSGYILSWNGTQLVWITPPVTTNIPNTSLQNSSITIGNSGVSLGGTLATIGGLTLTAPTLTGTLAGTFTIPSGTNITNPAVLNGTFTLPAIGSTGMTLAGSTSGTVTLIAQAIATGTMTVPSTASSDTLVAKNTTDTLTNKTLTSPVIATISNNGTLTLPAGVTDTLVARTTTETLTNKTIDGLSNLLKIKANSTATWAAYAGTLDRGEIGYDYERGYFRIGNGSYAWSSMPYGFYQQPNLTGNINKFLQVTGSVGSEVLSWSSPSYSQLADNPNALTIDQAAGIAATNLTVGNVAQTAYTFNSHYSGNNPTLSVTGGTTVAFNLGAAGHPFQIQSNGGSGSTYTNITAGLTWVGTNGSVQSGALAQAQMSGTLYWNVPASVSAGTLYRYQCASHTVMNGVITWNSPIVPAATPQSTSTTLGTVYGNSSNLYVPALGYGTLGGGSFSSPYSAVYIGYQSGYNVTNGDKNIAIGGLSLQNGGSASYNTVIGTESGKNITGNNNIVIGYNSGNGSSSGISNSIIIGSNAAQTTSNEITLGDSNITSFRIPGLSVSIGTSGYSGRIAPRTTTVTDTATPTPSATTDDFYVITALTQTATFAAPTGTPVNGQSLKIRIKDNGTARTLAWNAAYRASADLALPTTTVANKTLYLGFVYNSTDSKWDLVARLGNF